MDPLNGSEEEEILEMRKSQIVPTDVRQLVIRDLDTGDAYLVGENEPDFEYNTYEIGLAGQEQQPTEGGTGVRREPMRLAPPKPSWFRRMTKWLFSKNSNDVFEDDLAWDDETEAGMTEEEHQRASAVRSPFSKLSSFKFRRELGRGAFGRVLLAESKSDGRMYALKIMNKKGMRSSDRRQARAERDILLSMAGKDPNPFTTGLKFAFQSENNLYLGMEFLPGGSLKALVQRFGSLPEPWVRFYAAELVLALSHLHSLDVLYRDIKPHNVMIDGYGHVVLIDFGLSKQGGTGDGKGATSLVGTPDYSAPEVLKTGVYRLSGKGKEKEKVKDATKTKSDAGGSGQNDEKDGGNSTGPSIGYGKPADWWSLGVMIYEMLHGRPPFRGRDLRETYKNVLFMDITFPPEPYVRCTVDATMTTPSESGSSGGASLFDGASRRGSSPSTGGARRPNASGAFSPAAQLTLAHLLRRTPSSRLGGERATSSYNPEDPSVCVERDFPTNPPPGLSPLAREGVSKVPKDILCSPFFADVYSAHDWGRIYARADPGPWLPEPDAQLVRKGFRNYALLDARERDRRRRRKERKERERLEKSHASDCHASVSTTPLKEKGEGAEGNVTPERSAAGGPGDGKDRDNYEGFEFGRGVTDDDPPLTPSKAIGEEQNGKLKPGATSPPSTPSQTTAPHTPDVTLRSPTFTTPAPGQPGHHPPGVSTMAAGAPLANEASHLPPSPPPSSSTTFVSASTVTGASTTFVHASLGFESEQLAVRDSVIAGPNRRPDAMLDQWSFVDEGALMSASGGKPSASPASLHTPSSTDNVPKKETT